MSLNNTSLDHVTPDNLFVPDDVSDLYLLEQVILLVYLIPAAVVGLAGNVTVLYASLKYNALKLDQISVIFIRNLAIADLLYICVALLPSCAVYATKQNLPLYCPVQAHVALWLGCAIINFVLVITTFRLFKSVIFPFGMDRVTVPRARALVVCLWLYSAAPLGAQLKEHEDARFYVLYGRCYLNIISSQYPALVITMAGVFILLPIILLFINNMILLRFALGRTSGTADQTRRAIRMILFLSGIFLFSYLPYVTNSVLKALDVEQPRVLHILAYNTIHINTFSNPILYGFTNRKFRRFIIAAVKRNTFVDSAMRKSYRISFYMDSFIYSRSGVKNETVPEGGKVASGELDISRDSEVNMSRDMSLHNSSRVTGLDNSALHFVNDDTPSKKDLEVPSFKDFSAPVLKTPTPTKKKAPRQSTVKSSTPVVLKRRLTLPQPKNSSPLSPIKTDAPDPDNNPEDVPTKKTICLPEITSPDDCSGTTGLIPPGMEAPEPVVIQNKSFTDIEEAFDTPNTTDKDEFDLDETDDDLMSKFLSLKKKFGRGEEVLSDSLVVNTSMRDAIVREEGGEQEEAVTSNKKFKMEIHNELDSTDT